MEGNDFALPPRPADQHSNGHHERSWSGGINFSGVQNVFKTMTPPLLHRKRGVEETAQDFHEKNQKFLREEADRKRHQLEEAARLAAPTHVRSGSFRSRSKLAAINDTFDDIGDEKESDSLTCENTLQSATDPQHDDGDMPTIVKTRVPFYDDYGSVGSESTESSRVWSHHRQLSDGSSGSSLVWSHQRRLSSEEELENKLQHFLERPSPRVRRVWWEHVFLMKGTLTLDRIISQNKA